MRVNEINSCAIWMLKMCHFRRKLDTTESCLLNFATTQPWLWRLHTGSATIEFQPVTPLFSPLLCDHPHRAFMQPNSWSSCSHVQIFSVSAVGHWTSMKPWYTLRVHQQPVPSCCAVVVKSLFYNRDVVWQNQQKSRSTTAALLCVRLHWYFKTNDHRERQRRLKVVFLA